MCAAAPFSGVAAHVFSAAAWHTIRSKDKSPMSIHEKPNADSPSAFSRINGSYSCAFKAISSGTFLMCFT